MQNYLYKAKKAAPAFFVAAMMFETVIAQTALPLEQIT